MKGNVQLSEEEQFDELRICVEKSFNKLRGRIDRKTAQGLIGKSRMLDRMVAGLLLKRTTVSRPPIWGTIKLGTGLKSADDFVQALCSVPSMFHSTKEMRSLFTFCPFTAADKEIEIDLVVVEGVDLGFKRDERVHRNQIYKKAQEIGLKLCPPEVGPQLRLQYIDQPLDEELLIAMEPIDNAVFCVHRMADGPVKLDAYTANGDSNSWQTTGYLWAFQR